jgi:hypothetical protein
VHLIPVNKKGGRLCIDTFKVALFMYNMRIVMLLGIIYYLQHNTDLSKA